jgi:CDP-diglyceride synthetase
MELKFFLSVLVTIFSLAVVLIGLPAQIIKNQREKRSGQPVLTLLIMLGFYASQIAFFIVTESYLPLISFIIGLVMWGTLLVQYFMYRSAK